MSLGNDPVYTHVIPETAVTKPSTVSTEYVFGERNSFGYISWTGWRKSTAVNPIRNNTTIDSDTNLIAVFNSKQRSYPVYWYLRENDSTPVQISEENVLYGGNCDELAPTVYYLKEHNYPTFSISISGSNCTYSIFKGW